MLAHQVAEPRSRFVPMWESIFGGTPLLLPGALFVGGLTRVKVCAEGGDSGGSFITGVGQAQGVLSGGNYSCKGNQASLAKSYYQPLNPLLQAYNLTLKTSP